MNNIIIGQYVPGTSFLYKLDPRSKLISLLLFMVAVFLVNKLIYMGYLLIGLIIVLRLGGIQVTRILKGLRPIIFLLTFTFIFQILFVEGGNQLVNEPMIFTPYNLLIFVGMFILWRLIKKVFPFRFLLFILFIVSSVLLFIFVSPGNEIGRTTLVIYENGLIGALFIMLRLIIIVTLSTILTLTTKPTDLNLGLERVLKPLKYVGISTEIMAMIISIALRYIPTLLDEANKIMLAQASRGVDFSEGKFKDKIMQIISLLVPMFIISFKRSDELADAMEARNFVPGKNRTRLHTLTWGYMDTMLLTLGFATIVLVIWMR